MRVADGLAQPVVQPGAIDDHLLVVDVADGRERHSEFSRVFDIDDDLRSSSRRDHANGAERHLAVMGVNLEIFFDCFASHTSSPVPGLMLRGPHSYKTRDGAVVWRHSVGEIEHYFVHIAPAPALRRIVAFDDRVLAPVKMLRRVLVRR